MAAIISHHSLWVPCCSRCIQYIKRILWVHESLVKVKCKTERERERERERSYGGINRHTRMERGSIVHGRNPIDIDGGIEGGRRELGSLKYDTLRHAMLCVSQGLIQQWLVFHMMRWLHSNRSTHYHLHHPSVRSRGGGEGRGTFGLA
mgnify:CR=1 FL=1